MKHLILWTRRPQTLVGVMLGWVVAASAWAGDPCPISIDLYEARPSWRDHSADLKALKTKRMMLGINSKLGSNGAIMLRPRAGGPAQRSGVQDKDELVSINGQPSSTAANNKRIFDQALRETPDAVLSLQVKRNGQTLTLDVKPEPADPVFWGMVNAGEDADCRAVSSRSLTPDQQQLIEKALVDAQRSFLCADAHQNRALQKAFQSGSLIVMRGGRRVILVMPGWQTTCIDSSDYDRDELNKASEQVNKTWAKLLERVSARYVKDRFNNP